MLWKMNIYYQPVLLVQLILQLKKAHAQVHDTASVR